MSRTVTIDVDNQYLHFSAAHFTIFSATERERLHGHNFTVRARAEAPVGDNGMAFNYQLLKTRLRDICQQLDEYTLIAEDSPYLQIAQEGDYVAVTFNTEKMLLLRSDTLLLPVRNITSEEIGRYLIDQLRDTGLFDQLDILRLQLDVGSGPGQRVTSEYIVDKSTGV